MGVVTSLKPSDYKITGHNWLYDSTNDIFYDVNMKHSFKIKSTGYYNMRKQFPGYF